MKPKGFTLVELVVVIIILGILAVVAAPKFLSIGSDANIAALKGYKGSLESAFTGFISKTYMPSSDIIEKPVADDSPLRYTILNGEKVRFANDDHSPFFEAYPSPDPDGKGLKQLKSIANIDLTRPEGNGKFKISFACATHGGFYIYPDWNEDVGLSCNESKQCYLEYDPKDRGHGEGLDAEFHLYTKDC